MEAICNNGDTACMLRVLSAVLHTLHVYIAALAVALLYCCAPKTNNICHRRWRGQMTRGVASIIYGFTSLAGGGAALLRTGAIPIASSLLAIPAWFLAEIFHVTIWSHRMAAPLLYLTIYWLSETLVATAIATNKILTEDNALDHVELYIHLIMAMTALTVSFVDSICFYDEVSKKYQIETKKLKSSNSFYYKHNEAHFYSKISYLWISPLLYRGYQEPLDQGDVGDLPENENSRTSYEKLKKILKKHRQDKKSNIKPNLWKCYKDMVWPNFYLAGALKLLGDMSSLIPPLGLAVIIQHIEGPHQRFPMETSVTTKEYFSNGYTMLLIVCIALVSQAFLSQYSSHLTTVEGTRLKTALQGILYDKCMRLAPWSSSEPDSDEDSPLLRSLESRATSESALLTNLISQDTYNVMSCVCIYHYVWAIPLKVAVILYLLYTKLGLSAIIGSAVSILIITPLQFYIGKKISDNSKAVAKCTDHRVSKMAEILHGLNVITLYVWEDLFKEKILNLREVELKLLNRESAYWGFLTFTTQVSTILVTVITFTIYSLLESSDSLTAVNIFSGLALFHQLAIPLLVLPVTVLLVIQAMVSTKRMEEFLELPESNNSKEDDEDKDFGIKKRTDKFNDAFIGKKPKDNLNDINKTEKDEAPEVEFDQYSDDDTINVKDSHDLVRFRNARFSWGTKGDTVLEIDNFEIPSGKLIMVVGSTGSGKTSLLSAILGEMNLEQGDVIWNSEKSTWYSGQPPWLIAGSVKENITLGSPWCPRRYARVLKAVGLRPDIQLLPEGDSTQLGSHGSPLSGGQRVRVCLARALYSKARLLALDEPLAALDTSLARHVIARGFVPAARRARTVILATGRLDLLHYADIVIVMENGRIAGIGSIRGAESNAGALGSWARQASAARATAARIGAGPPGGVRRERAMLMRAVSHRAHTINRDDLNRSEPARSVLLAGACVGLGADSWRGSRRIRSRPLLSRQLSSPPAPPPNRDRWRRTVRRALSVNTSRAPLQRASSIKNPPNNISRWTPRTLRRLLHSESEPATNLQNSVNSEDSTMEAAYSSITANGNENGVINASDNSNTKEDDEIGDDDVFHEWPVWMGYLRACGWWGAAWFACGVGAHVSSLGAHCWLATLADKQAQANLTSTQMLDYVRTFVCISVLGCALAGACSALGGGAAGRARRRLHEVLLRREFRSRDNGRLQSELMHTFSHDVHVIDKKLPIAVSRWQQLSLLCVTALLLSALAAPWSLVGAVPLLIIYCLLQELYLRNVSWLSAWECRAAASRQTECGGGGAGSARAGRLQPALRSRLLARADSELHAALLNNAAARLHALAMDLLGACSVAISMGLSLLGGQSGGMAGLAGGYALLLPAYAAHAARSRADLHAHAHSLRDACAPDDRKDCNEDDDMTLPVDWERRGKIVFENVSARHDSSPVPIIHDINITILPGEKVVICGRSGSGKTTLLLSCVGATKLTSGRILIDDQDLGIVPIRALRHRLVVLPQDPILFSGTLRENLDPLGVHTDEEIWQSLRNVGLYDFVSSQPAGLEWCASGWVGCGRAARACGARASLAAGGAAALLMDEPPTPLAAALMRIADTVITVAHQMSTVRLHDRAIILEEGRVVEQGRVSDLLSQRTSKLSRLLASDEP